jgi:thiamine-monophosphate kinase
MALLLPDWPDLDWLKAFAAGLAADQAEFGLSLMGGDTSSTPGALAVSISAIGFVPHGAMIRRAGARSGDAVFVSGTIGDAGGGLAVLQGEAGAQSELVARYRRPRPRLLLGQALRGLASASLDVSDGLIADLAHLARTSGVRLEIDASRIPLSAALRAVWGSDTAAICRAAVSGDDYEIAFTAVPERRDAVLAASARSGVAVTEIGRVTAGEGVVLLDGDGKEIALPRKGFVHF